jgi:signal peptidase II
MQGNVRAKLTPLLLPVVLIAADQISKAVIVNTIRLHTIGSSLFDGLIRIVHTRNLGVAFSMGIGLPDGLRSVLFTLLPIVILGILVIHYFRNDQLTPWERWSIAAVLGGGIGNLIDRIFRPKGVVDFIDVKFFGIFGMERWPTFNIADASVVVGGIILIISILLYKEEEQKGE